VELATRLSLRARRAVSKKGVEAGDADELELDGAHLDLVAVRHAVEVLDQVLELVKVRQVVVRRVVRDGLVPWHVVAHVRPSLPVCRNEGNVSKEQWGAMNSTRVLRGLDGRCVSRENQHVGRIQPELLTNVEDRLRVRKRFLLFFGQEHVELTLHLQGVCAMRSPRQ
jgi:hypothetical protein